MDAVDTITQVISSLGFPIAVAWYMMTKMNSTMEKMTESLNNLTGLINSIKEKE